MPEASEHDDGRRARGQRRRAAIIAATLRVIERDGVAGLSHRAVAREAEVPASSAVYYFATLDDLLVAALTDAADAYARQLRDFVEGDRVGAGVAELIAAAGHAGRGRMLAEYELTLLAARRPALRPVARRWIDLVADIARRYTDDPVAVRAVVAATDGLCLEALFAEDTVTAEDVRAVLVHILRLDLDPALHGG
ncbi:TetR/AcrR family transcriptional regulator [Nocardiopsis ansamitocini]|uniref:TetR family transcriptional regulator n=1 Tax=Nocardiopsis ansamitocini TaxID=1670832 RepID=A0A9W6P2M2_9ACTN|nr:TetR family transcriptional regulator [Nocardiopsis ansamitocini]GLU46120.1 TetR family transcriptional regulator [Nocardiopsis ansamitocini]